MNYNIEENTLYIFTDWASRPVFNHKLNKKTGRYGWMGVWFVYYDKNFKPIEENKSYEISHTQGTNQDMELWAPIGALKYLTTINLSDFRKVIVVTDCDWLCEHRKCAVYGYRDKPWINWKTKDGDLVKHKRERKKLAKYRREVNRIHKKSVEFERIKGHQKDNPNDERVQYNKKADASAVKWAQSKKRIWNSTVSLRAPFFKDSKRNKETYLNVWGQKIYIHIHNSTYFRKKWYRYNYEVVSWDSPYFMQTAWIHYNKKTLSAEYIYLVKMKDDGSHQIEEIISTHTKQEIKEKMIEEWIDTSILYWKLSK